MVKLSKPINGFKIDLNKLNRIKFPHYTSEEQYIAKKFIESKVIDGEWYADVKLKSRKAEFITEEEELNFRYMWEQLTAKRIDLVCVSKNVIYIIEIKRYMLSSGIGQLLTYRDMFIAEYKPDCPVFCYYVVYYSDPDIIEICKRKGIYYWYLV